MTIPSHSVFSDPVFDQKFREDGYFVTPLLTSDEVRQLLEIDNALMPDLPCDFHGTAYHPDRDHRARIRQAVAPILDPRVLSLLIGYRNANTDFISKRPTSTRGTLGMHQDFTLVDQQRVTGVHVWIPLIDVDEDNGCLCVYPGTHSLVNHISAMSFQNKQVYPSPYDPVRSLVERNCGVRVPMSAGSALFFNERLLHSSGENKTPSRRVALVGGYVPENEPTYLYSPSGDNPNILDVLTVADFNNLRLGTGEPMPYPYPDGVAKVDTIEYHFEPLTPEQILPLYRPQPRPAEFDGAPRVKMDNPAPPIATPAKAPSRSRLAGFMRGAKRALSAGRRS
jgi:hypothetical protein